MRLSNLFARTLRETPSDAEMISHQLSVRAGLIVQAAAGIYSYLPLGWRALRKIIQIIREEMDAVDGQEILMPVVQPAGLWRESGRYDAPAPGAALVRFSDRGEHPMVLAMTHEELVTDLARRLVNSYRQLPAVVYQVQTKFRDEARSRGGLVRVREFTMKDAYSFHADQEDLDAYYPRMYAAYEQIFRRCGLEVVAVEASSGMMGGSDSHEFIFVNDAGEDTLVLCPDCKFAANAEAAHFDKGEALREEERPLEKVPTPGTTTIEAVARLLGVGEEQTLKAVFYATAQSEIVFAVIRGDLDVNEQKLADVLGGVELHPADAEELEAAGLVAGYASPIGLDNPAIRVIADDSILTGSNYVAGANDPGYHYANANYPRDMQVDQVADIALAREGDRCIACGGSLRAVRGIELGHVFKLGTKYSEAMGADFLDATGASRPLVMGCYGIGAGRLLACILEQHHDDNGIVWPVDVAPMQVHIVSVGTNNPEVVQAAEAAYQRLQAAGYEVLYDDRDETAGVKFNDADLIGLPVRVTVSRRTVQGEAFELKARWEADRQMVPAADLEGAVAAILERGRQLG